MPATGWPATCCASTRCRPARRSWSTPSAGRSSRSSTPRACACRQPSSEPATVAGMNVGVLGPLRVQQDGREVAVGGGRLRALLARLALDAGRPVTSGALVDAVWDTELPADHVHSLQSLVSRLRRALGESERV